MKAVQRGAQAGAARGQALVMILRKSTTRRGFLARRRIVSATASRGPDEADGEAAQPGHVLRAVAGAAAILVEGPVEDVTYHALRIPRARGIPCAKATEATGPDEIAAEVLASPPEPDTTS